MKTKHLKTNTSKYFYRIEYGNWGDGLYLSGVIDNKIRGLQNMVKRHCDPTILPNEYNDKVIRNAIRLHRGIHFKFCFNSKKDMDRLITKREMKILIKNDCAVYRIRSSHYYSSKYQTIIDKDRIIDKVDISCLYKL